MSEVPNELDILFEKIKGNKKILKFSENITINELKRVCDASSEMTNILHFENNSFSMMHLNKSSMEFFDVSEDEYSTLGFEFVLRTTHPDNLDSVYMLIKFFNDPNNAANTFTHTLCLNTPNGWEWVYSMSRPATRNEDGTVRYLVSVSFKLDDLLNTHKQDTQFNNSLTLYEENMEKYNSLTAREREVLKHIAMELTSKEISEVLFISASTVDTHRKHLIEKLNVKSSIGLIKYALLFNLV